MYYLDPGRYWLYAHSLKGYEEKLTCILIEYIHYICSFSSYKIHKPNYYTGPTKQPKAE